MPGYLLDSDVLIDVLRGRPEAKDAIDRLMDRGEVPAISVIGVLEVEGGMRSGEEIATQALLESFDLRVLDLPTSRLAADFVRRERGAGRTLSLPDAVVAASASTLGATLVTRNRSHYEHLPMALISPAELLRGRAP